MSATHGDGALTPLPVSHLGEVSTDTDANMKRYCEILSCVEELIQDHILHDERGAYILNYAQVYAIAPTLKLITFDGDMTLYADGADFAKDSQLVDLLIGLLREDLYVAIVTAAGYGNDHARYEKRLSGLLEGIQKSDLSHEAQKRFFVLGGECNYMFQWNPNTTQLEYLPEETYQPSKVQGWAKATSRISGLLDKAQASLEQCAKEMNLASHVQIIRKDRAVGLIAKNGFKLTREQLDEFALSTQRRLNNAQHLRLVKRSMSEIDSETDWHPIPFCAFNGGSDVWVDIGNKLIGVSILQSFLGAEGNETLHVGDQVTTSQHGPHVVLYGLPTRQKRRKFSQN
ncbi:hypothetical protein HK102_003493 [Quaeritorhiza haematococci]|nr:hypothetical protein HK102_003493 [Quaeritorhiza haematococci]